MWDKRIKSSRLLKWVVKVPIRLQFRAIFILMLSGMFLVGTAISNADVIDKAMLKALYTFKFGKFTHWPDSKLNATTPLFQYCILGQNQFSQDMKQLFEGKLIKGLPLSVEVFESGLVPEQVLSSCHVVFISQSEKHRLATIFASLKQRPVLTVSDIQEFSHLGGMITLTENHGKLHFQINPKAFQRAGIAMSSKILELAEIIDDGGEG